MKAYNLNFEGDEYAKAILTKYTASIKEAGKSGDMNEAVQDNIYGTVVLDC